MRCPLSSSCVPSSSFYSSSAAPALLVPWPSCSSPVASPAPSAHLIAPFLRRPLPSLCPHNPPTTLLILPNDFEDFILTRPWRILLLPSPPPFLTAADAKALLGTALQRVVRVIMRAFLLLSFICSRGYTRTRKLSLLFISRRRRLLHRRRRRRPRNHRRRRHSRRGRRRRRRRRRRAPPPWPPPR